MEVYCFSLDIKAGLNRRPSIIEFNASDNSGQIGYTRAGLGDMFNDKIIPDLQRHIPERPIIGLGQDDNFYDAYENAENGHAVFIKRDSYAFRNEVLHAISRAQHDQIIANASLCAHSLYQNKAAAAQVLQNAPDILNDHVPTFICPMEYHRGLGDQAVSQLGHHDRYVIKPVAALGGDGVRIVSRKDLSPMLREIMTSLRQMDKSKVGYNYWLSDKEPLLIIQPYIPSDMVYKNGKPYDGTMRVFASLYRRNKDDDFTPVIHDAYWKLPMHSGGKISYSPSCSEKSGPIKTLFNALVDNRYRHINSLAVDEAMKNHVFDCLRESLPQMGKAMFGISHQQLVKRNLFSKNTTEQALGVMLATHPELYLSDYPTSGQFLYPVCSMSDNVPPRLHKLYKEGAPFIAKSIRAKADEWQGKVDKSFWHKAHPIWIESYERIHLLPKRQYPKPKSRFPFIGKMLALDV